MNEQISTARSHRIVIVAIVAASFAATLGIGMLIPAIPQLTAGLPGVAHGVLISSFGVARVAVGLPSGLAIDRVGVRPSAVVGLAMLIAGSLLGIGDLGFGLLIAAVALQGAGIAVFSTAAMTALIIDFGPTQKGAAQSWFQGALLLSYSAGPSIGGYVVGAFGPRAPFVIEALLCVMAILAALLMPVTNAQPRKPGRRFGLTAGLAGAAALTFGGFLARITVSWVIVPVVAVSLALSPLRYGLIIGVCTAVNLALLPINAKLIDGWSVTLVVWTATALVLGGTLLMWLVPTQGALWIGTALVMAGTGALVPAAGVVALEGVPPESTAAITGMNRSAGDVGAAVGPVLVSGATTAFHLNAADGFAVTAAALLLCVAFYAATCLGRKALNL